jgi:hypothetical protein
MAYSRNPTWQDGVAGGTLITAATLNKLEDGLVDAAGDADGAVTGLAGKAPTVHTHTASAVTDFSEAVDDRVAALVKAGANVTLTYDDTAGTLTIASAASGGGGAGGMSTPVGEPGMWMTAPIRSWSATSNQFQTAGLGPAMWVAVSTPITVDALALYVDTAEAGATFRLGLYGPAATGLAGPLLSSVSVPATTTGHIVGLLPAPVALTPGVYWLVARGSSSAVARIRGAVVDQSSMVSYNVTASANTYMLCANFGTAAALTPTITTWDFGYPDNVPLVGMRRSA